MNNYDVSVPKSEKKRNDNKLFVQRKPVILCVDDEKALLETLERLIVRRFGREFDVETADSGDEGLEVLEEFAAEGRPVALIVSDQLMPGLNGDEFLARSMKYAPDTPKILLTGQADMEAVVYAINYARLFRYIPKPWDDEDLIRSLREATQIYRQKITLDRYARLFHSINLATQRISTLLDKCSICRMLAESAVQTCAATRVEVMRNDCKTCEYFDREYIRQLSAASTTNVLDVPIYHGEQCIGRMIMENGHRFDQVDLEAAEILASQAAISHTTARLYEELTATARQLDEHRQALEKYNRDVKDSIVYAHRIQQAILPERETFDRLLPENFVLYQPKDIVSGDFYFWRESEGILTLAVCDCTGHGVPGAFVSLIASECLHSSAKTCDDPAAVLESMEAKFKRRIKGRLDTVDIAVVRLDFKNQTARFAGARRPLWIVRNGELLSVSGTRKSLGENTNVSYTGHEIQLLPGDVVYLFTDGVVDQFGGENNRKFKPQRLNKTLRRIYALPLAEQAEILRNEIESWRGDNEYTDDILMVGFRFPG